MSTHTQRLSALTRASVRTMILPQVFLTEEYMAIAMEYAAGGDMFQLVVRQRGLPEADARWYFQQLIIAIDYCHRMVRLLCNASLLQSQMQVPFPVTHHPSRHQNTCHLSLWYPLKLSFLPYRSVPRTKLTACNVQCDDLQFSWLDKGVSFFLLDKPFFGSALCMIDPMQRVQTDFMPCRVLQTGTLNWRTLCWTVQPDRSSRSVTLATQR
jgi:hypothetical protein